MKERRSKLLIEPPATATGDIAFNLIVFFLVCASVQPDSGRSQTIPRADESEQQQEEQEDTTVEIARGEVAINGQKTLLPEFRTRIRERLAGKTADEDRIVIVKSKSDVPYDFWIRITSTIEDAGGIITLQIEEEREVTIPE